MVDRLNIKLSNLNDDSQKKDEFKINREDLNSIVLSSNLEQSTQDELIKQIKNTPEGSLSFMHKNLAKLIQRIRANANGN